MVKKCESCGEVYSIVSAIIDSPEVGQLKISEITVALNFKDVDGKDHFQEFDLCPDCLEKVFKILDPTIESETKQTFDEVKGGIC